MNLLKKLERSLAFDPNDRSNWYYKPKNYRKGLCNNCEEKLYRKGKSWTTCEYHYLKKKFTTAKSRIEKANESRYPDQYRHLRGIKCTITWEKFINWCVNNPEYKKMKMPNLVRKNKKGNFSLRNIMWVDGKA